MAEYEERSLEDLTEEPSQHRLDELRAKGQVAQSKELTSTIVFLGILCVLYFISSRFITDYSGLLKETFTVDIIKPLEIDHQKGGEWRTFADFGGRCFKIVFNVFTPISVVALLLGILASVAQIGMVFTTETLNPDFERVNPISGFFRIFSFKSVFEALRSILKIVVIVCSVYFVLKAELIQLSNLGSYSRGQLLGYLGKIFVKIFSTVGVLLLATSGLDYFVQWRRFRRQAMMTKAEAKKEAKEREGDPQIKARIRTIQREAARKRMMKSVPKADVVITNPTHIAIAIIYDPEAGFAPKVIAKGADFLAERIKKIARENGVPTVENKPLARTLYKHVKVGQMIPRSLYQAVAEILAYVYRLKGKTKTHNPSNDKGL